MRALLVPVVLLAVACRADKEPPDTGEAPVVIPDEDGDGYTSDADCDDTNAAISPDAAELCDGLDNNCDGTVDESATDAITWYADGDGDGIGVEAYSLTACEAPEGYSAEAGDCDDSDAAIHPGAPEDDCLDPTDYNCDGQVGYADADADGYAACEECDDSNRAVNPSATEICDDVDNNCDGEVDVGAVDADTWYQDQDADGWGDSDYTQSSCDTPEGYAAQGEDCDDTEPLRSPGLEEVCDDLDNDCDQEVDEDDATDASTWYADADDDGYGNPARSTTSCEAPSGYTDNSGDCDDTEELAWTGATESCDGADNDCDGSVDEGVLTSWTLDRDGDGYGEDGTAVLDCDAPTSAYVSSGGDCDDSDTAYNPGAAAGCDGEDYNCDGLVDNDADGDLYADINCGGDDCVDTDASIQPDNTGDCALGTSCEDILDKGYSTGDGLYSVDYDGYASGEDPETVHCEMDDYGGGWTLLATNGGSGWSAALFLSSTTFSSASTTNSYRGGAWFHLPLTDLMFTDGSLYAVYEGVDGGTQSFYDWQASIPVHNCGSTSGYVWSMTQGNFASSDLCDTNLYMHPIDEDGGVNSVCNASFVNANNATGPAWSSPNNNGCPLDDTSSTSWVSDSNLSAWGTAVAIYGR